ncbi:hypothetical protein T484DRAFT_1897855, partial [Baffinella frigidus]
MAPSKSMAPSAGEKGGSAGSLQREEAARERRRGLEEGRKAKGGGCAGALKGLEEGRKVKAEQAGRDKDVRAEGHQRKIIEERMAALGVKEARIRAQAAQLHRLASDMQARLEEVVTRRNGYMQQIVAKAQATAARKHPSGEDEGAGDASLRSSRGGPDSGGGGGGGG